ncbi:MAG: isoprenylcysteine carboxylmethyltransferase family protein, partial [Pseudomonadota bacterium]
MNTHIPPVVQVLLCGVLGWGLSTLAPSPQMGGPWFLFLAAILFGSGFVLLVFAVGAFVRENTTVNPLDPESAETLVTSGLFRFSRNPMYLGMLFVLTACMILLGAWSSMFAPVLFIWAMTEFQIKPEEHA